ncbi:MAG: CYTH and CHAD domain-containing protein, partial [Acidimicrobiales bacterium]
MDDDHPEAGSTHGAGRPAGGGEAARTRSEGQGAAGEHGVTEVEWQFDALDLRPVERWLAALASRVYPGAPPLTVLAKPTRRLVDRYMDTADFRVAQAGFALRTRQRGRAVEVTLKETRPADPTGVRTRLELSESLPAGLGSLGTGGPVGRRVRAVVGRRQLGGVLEVRTRRQPFSLRAAGAEIAEVALDDTTILVGQDQAPARLRRVEVEVAPGWLETLRPVVEDLRASAGLSPAVVSKFEAGLLAAGISIPGPPDVGPTDVGPEATLGDVAYAVIRRQLRELYAHEPGTRLGENPEELHDLRVATRRLRAAMDLFSSALPSRASAVREELRWIAGELGAVRDLDVQLDELTKMGRWSDEWAGTGTGTGTGTGLAHLHALLTAERDRARESLLDALDSSRWERLTAALLALARQGPSGRVPGARVPAAIAVPPLLDRHHHAMLAAAKRARRTGTAHDFHRVRIRGKRLRYSLEFTSPLYGQPALHFAKRLTQLQDALGRMQDAEVASSRLLSLATAPPGATLPPATIFVMGAIAERYRQESARLRSSLPKSLETLRGREWHDLRDAVDRARRRAEALAAAPPYAPPTRTSRAPARRVNGEAPPADGHLGAGAGDDPPAAAEPAVHLAATEPPPRATA